MNYNIYKRFCKGFLHKIGQLAFYPDEFDKQFRRGVRVRERPVMQKFYSEFLADGVQFVVFKSRNYRPRERTGVYSVVFEYIAALFGEIFYEFIVEIEVMPYDYTAVGILEQIGNNLVYRRLVFDHFVVYARERSYFLADFLLRIYKSLKFIDNLAVYDSYRSYFGDFISVYVRKSRSFYIQYGENPAH